MNEANVKQNTEFGMLMKHPIDLVFHKTMHISPTPNLKPLKQNNVHKRPCRFNVHKTTSPMFTMHTNHETPKT